MQAYVTNSMPAYITSWLNTNVNPVGSAVVVDSSLTVSGAAADAKVVGDKVAGLDDLEDDLDNLKSALDDVQDILDIYVPPTASGITPANDNVNPVLTGLSLIAGHSYKYEVEYETPSDAVSYLSWWITGNQSYSGVATINAGATSGYGTINPQINVSSAYLALTPQGRALKYTVKFIDLSTTNRIDEIKTNIDGLKYEVYNFDEETEYDTKYGLTIADGQWVYSASNVCAVIHVTPGDKLKIEKSTGESYYCMLRSKNNMSSGQQADLATGYTGAKSITSATPVDITVQDDAHFVWIYFTDGTSNYKPTELTINGYSVIESLIGNVYDLSKSVDGLQDTVDGLQDTVAALDTEMNTVAKTIYKNFIWDDYLTKFSIVSGGKWQKNSYDSAVIVPVESGASVYLNRNGIGYYSILKSLDHMTGTGQPVDFATGYSSYVTYNDSGATVTVPEDGHYIWVYVTDNIRDYSPTTFLVDGLEVHYTLRGNLAQSNATIASLDGRVAALEDNTAGQVLEIADSNYDELTPFSGSNLVYKTKAASKNNAGTNRNVVAVNHDDLQPSDYINIRKVYNKFGFHANFNFILNPFSSVANKNERVKNTKKIIAEGHSLGLHAIFQESFWWMNKMYDVRPDGTLTFAPTLSDLKTDVGDGRNAFGYLIDLSETLAHYGFVDLPSEYSSITLGNMTDEQYASVIEGYTLYNSNVTVTGLDLDDVSRTWTYLQWLEHWYNRLIDDTLGYSATGDRATRYATDYSGTYPSESDLLSGNLSGAGHFTKGLFKGAVSSCNYEVRERCIQIARAFCLHYFGTDELQTYGRHGVRYVDLNW